MKVLLTGANGYVSRRLLPELLLLGHEVVCAVRDKNRLGIDEETLQKISIWEVDFTKPYEETAVLKDVDIAYYMIHSMSTSIGDFDELEKSSAKNFNRYLENSTIKQVIYLSGIVNNNSLSKHLQSRLNVEQILFSG
ncbi:MAG: NAD(P)H-binding protein, partial [Bacteroidota bacterium]